MSDGEQSPSGPTPLGPWKYALAFGAPTLVVIAYALLNFFDDTTEPYPAHDTALNACFAAAGFAGVAAGIVVFFRVKGWAAWRKIVTTIMSPFAVAIFVFLFANEITTSINNHRDFPADRTTTSPALIPISRAYATHGKRDGYHIQTMPLWSDMQIEESDFRFMRAHRAPIDVRKEPDEIRSNGYFCARVTVQQSGNALRVLHAGNRTLPRGTVIVCPGASAGTGP